MEKLSSKDNIAVDYEEGQLEEDVTLSTKLLDETDEAYHKIDLSDKILNDGVTVEDIRFKAYDITLFDASQNVVQPDGTVQVSIPCPEGYDGAECKIYRVEENGSLTNMNATCSANVLSFQTNHFSTYLITETELRTESAFTYGDVNGDGEVDSKDAVLLKKYLAGFEDAIERLDQNAADVNGDGSITSADAVRLLKALAGYDVILGQK